MIETKMSKGTETLALLLYTRDNDGQLKKTTSKELPGTEITEYTYDENNRLTKAGTTTYEYDPADNPTKTGSSTNTYNAADELEKGTGVSYAYDELGERTKQTPTTGPATTYGYDQAGNLTSITRPKEGEVSAIEDTYAYDGNGLRASQTISGATSYMAWDIPGSMPLLLNGGTNNFIYGPGNLPFEQISNGGTVTYLHHDQQGTTRMLTSSTGAKEATFTYDSYGNKTGATGTATTSLGYDGQYTGDAGLIYLRARAYEPATAQFMSVDPLEEWTREPYTYVDDNPLNHDDPLGLFPWGAIAEGVGVGASCLLGPEVCVSVGLVALDAHVIAADISSAETGCSPRPKIVPALVAGGVSTLPFAGGLVAKQVWEASHAAFRVGAGVGIAAGGLTGAAAASSASGDCGC